MKQKTVVITGASSGIGMEFARAFSKMGCRLIFTARIKELRARLLLRIYQERSNAISFLKI